MEFSSETKTKILSAAASVFAEHGYRHGTIRQIAKKADVNVAAVNYYFGNKDNLYQEVLKSWTEEIFKKYPGASEQEQAMTVEDQLFYQIHQILSKLFDEEQMPWFGVLFVRMFTLESTDQFGELAESFYKPSVQRIVAIVRKLADKHADEKLLYFMATDIIGQCVFYYSNRRMLECVLPEKGSTMINVDYLSRKITDFSLAAIKGIS
ncbi:MAG: TetR/AcrR family transcriptional regulator [Lachnospiraceae bacterium]|nr:TetR/AcrR family transcriptional regulator [Lachnospiraceae bacterium]